MDQCSEAWGKLPDVTRQWVVEVKRVKPWCFTARSVFYLKICGRGVWQLAHTRRKTGVLPCEGHRIHRDP